YVCDLLKSHILSVTTVFSLSCLHPDVCSLRHEAGGCRNYTLMWFFNSSRQRCSPFWYSGCGGNENRFKTQRECETVCVTPGGREDVITQCQLDADAGLQCEDYVQAWFYDKNIAACTPFWYGGCGGNANRFNTEHECFQTCGTNSKSCLQPTTSLSCSRFWYGGCGGNENRFKTDFSIKCQKTVKNVFVSFPQTKDTARLQPQYLSSEVSPLLFLLSTMNRRKH
uniref:BPTI/Kunitz inhibitor domain-containing protein n=1 Tax=Seriola lalandi dorsalis TaxID=1841481 RepID=A0A3B4X5P0_SERLL